MKRDHSSFLLDWINSNTRKPLVIRGARQVGKTWLIRDLAESMQSRLIELNFEKRPDFESLFSSNEPKECLPQLKIETKRSLKSRVFGAQISYDLVRPNAL